MNTSTKIIIGVVLIAVIIFGFSRMSGNNNTESNVMMMDESMMIQEGVELTMAGQGMYVEYSEEKIARAENGDVVLFFHASWCPSCRGLDADIKESITDIPESLTILKVDYDTQTALKQKYGVTTQHTLVQVDQNGEMIKKWTGGGNLESLTQEVI